jgi:hypothetical protein
MTTQVNSTIECPFDNWSSFFPELPYTRDLLLIIAPLQQYFENYYSTTGMFHGLELHLAKQVVLVDYLELVKIQDLDVEQLFFANPTQFISCLDLAATQVFITDLGSL